MPHSIPIVPRPCPFDPVNGVSPHHPEVANPSTVRTWQNLCQALVPRATAQSGATEPFRLTRSERRAPVCPPLAAPFDELKRIEAQAAKDMPCICPCVCLHVTHPRARPRNWPVGDSSFRLWMCCQLYFQTAPPSDKPYTGAAESSRTRLSHPRCCEPLVPLQKQIVELSIRDRAVERCNLTLCGSKTIFVANSLLLTARTLSSMTSILAHWFRRLCWGCQDRFARGRG